MIPQKKSKTPRRLIMDPSKVPPQNIACSLIFLAGLLHWTTRPPVYVTLPFNYIGLFFICDGGTLIYWSRRLFIESGTPVSCAQSPAKIIHEGIYKTIRHPMYVGGVIMTAGIGIMAGTWPFFCVPVILFLIYDRIYIPREEKIMEDLFGEQYLLYKKSTRRWLYRII